MIRTRAALAGLVLVAASACSDSTSSQAGRLSLMLTDAPGDFVKAVVTIDRIYIQPSEGSSTGRVVLRETDVTVDLLTLANATAELVQDAALPAGSYAQLAFVVSGGYIEVENASGGTSIYASSPSYAGLPSGATVAGTLQMPSFAQTGIKVNLPGGAVEISGEQRILLVDFDVARSFGQQAGASGQWVMTPVLQASDLSLTGSLVATLRKADSVTMPSVNGTPATLAQFSAVLSTAAGSEEKLALTDANNDGVFEAHFRFLAPGSYAIDFVGPDGVTFTTTPARPATVSVTSGQQATQAFTITSAN